MITFYFRGMPFNRRSFTRTLDSLCSMECSAEKLRETFGGSGRNESIHIVAEFDQSTTPPTLLYRSLKYPPATCLGFRDDFPRFFIDQEDGNVWESEQRDGWGRLDKTPTMIGPKL